MLAWLSPELMQARDWAMPTGRVKQIDAPLTHDNISSTLLGLYEIDTALYQPSLDLFTQQLMNNGNVEVAFDRSADRSHPHSDRVTLNQ